MSKITKADLKAFAEKDFDAFAEMLSDILPEYVRLEWYTDVPYKSWLPKWQKAGFSILPNHYYSPIPDLNNLTQEILNKKIPLHGIEMCDAEQLKLLDELTAYKSEYSDFANRKQPREDGKYFLGGPFPPVDAMTSFAMIRKLKPRRIIEIGSGHSTLAMLEACHRNIEEGQPVDFISIDAYENPVKKFGAHGLSEFIEEKVEDLSPDFFQRLEENDILFVDSSHIIRPGNDVEFEYFSVIPILNRGVHVHVHDIFLPNPYPSNWVAEEHIFWNEQHLLAAFLSFNAEFKTTFAVSYLCDKFSESMRKMIPDEVEQLSGGSFWFKKV